jgi:hypothetical protein
VVRVGEYALEGEIGRGGMGTVYRARTGQGDLVAVKLVRKTDPQSLARFEREVRILRSLGEAEGFVPLVDAGVSGDAHYLVMPLVRGGTLRDRLDRGPLPEGEVRSLGAALARALAAAHERGIVHRDVKPENVLFTATGVPLLADLGLAKHFASSDGASLGVALSRQGELRGTAGYLAPEQIADAASVDGRADVFALGAVLYEAIAGVPAFTGESVLEMLGKIAEGRFEPLRGRAPADLAALVEACLAPVPEERLASAALLARALAGESVELPRRRRRPRVGVVILGFVAAALAVATGVVAAGVRAAERGGLRPEDVATATAAQLAEQSRTEAAAGRDGPAIELGARAVARAADLSREERQAIGAALEEVALLAGRQAFDRGDGTAEARAYELHGHALVLEGRRPDELPRAAEERHVAAQVLSGALGRRDLERLALPAEALARPPLLVACGHLYEVAVMTSASRARIADLESLALARFPVPPALRAAVARCWLDETRLRYEECRSYWQGMAVTNGGLADRIGALYEPITRSFVRAREADPSLPPIPEGFDPLFENLTTLFLRVNVHEKWPSVYALVRAFGDHPLVSYLDCREALTRHDTPGVFEAGRAGLARLEKERRGPGAKAIAELIAFDGVRLRAFDEYRDRFYAEADEAAALLDRLAAVSGSSEIAALVVAVRARDLKAFNACLVRWRDRIRMGTPDEIPVDQRERSPDAEGAWHGHRDRPAEPRGAGEAARDEVR